MSRFHPDIEHLMRRAGFGGTEFELSYLSSIGPMAAVDLLVDYDRVPDIPDGLLGAPGYAGVARSGGFSPNTNIDDARVRWLFRMVHGWQPLREKMALFWHNHFATGYSKISGAIGGSDATRLMAAKPNEDPAQMVGQIELFRARGMGNFRELLLAVSTDPAMLIWLDGRRNFKSSPQENYGRELLELFTLGIGSFNENDVRAAARVFTGWNLERVGSGDSGSYRFQYSASQHDTADKSFSFPIYGNGSNTIPARPASAGHQDGVDLVAALAAHPACARRLARKLYQFFVNDVASPDDGFINELAGVFAASGGEVKLVLRHLFQSPQFWHPANRFARYAWPAEFVVRTIKEIGWDNVSLRNALTPLVTMGQTLFNPPNVGGWITGRGWFGASSMLARMNFVRDVARSQRDLLAASARPTATSPAALVDHFLGRLTPAEISAAYRDELITYASGGGAWTNNQVTTKAAAVARLVCSSPHYQLI